MINNPTDLSEIKHKVGTEGYNRTTDSLEFLGETQSHVSGLFPISVANYITFVAGNVANAFGEWAEIVDDAANSMSDIFALATGHIGGVLVEDLSTKDKRYLFELAYGEDKTIIMRHRFLSGDTKKLDAIQYMQIRSLIVPVGETVYYRMMCETASETCEVSFRYHTH